MFGIRTRATKESRTKGFTLIELLVVIAIIALLAAILFPVFARARENARKSSCLNNLKQIAIGVAQYTQDFDEVYPLGYGPSATPPHFIWTQQFVPYIKSQQVFSCPSDSNKSNAGNGYATAGAAQGLPSGLFHVSYGANFGVFGSWQGGTQGFNMADMPKPAQVVLITDSGVAASASAPYVTTTVGDKGSAWLIADPTSAFTSTTKPGCCTTTTTDPNWSAPNPRHLETVNVSFADGHVKSLKPTAFYYPDTNWLNPRVGGP